MDRQSQIALSDNVRRLMEKVGWSQTKLGKKAGLGQRTISNLLNPYVSISPTMETIEKIAAVWGIQSWKLFISNIPLEILLSNSIDKLVESYKDLDRNGRESVDRIAENEMRYLKSPKTDHH